MSSRPAWRWIVALALVGCRSPATTPRPPVDAAHEDPPVSPPVDSPAVPTTDELAPAPRVEPPVDPDADHDGRLGPADRCPAQAETYEGTEDDDGCPDAPSLVRLSDAGDRIELLAKVVWKNAASGILAEPEPVVLRDLAALLHALPGVEIEIQAHEAPHEDLYGAKPTDRQARAVADWLISRGIDRQRILAVGYGESRPLASNRTAEGRAANARVEVWVRNAAGERADR